MKSTVKVIVDEIPVLDDSGGPIGMITVEGRGPIYYFHRGIVMVSPHFLPSGSYSRQVCYLHHYKEGKFRVLGDIHHYGQQLIQRYESKEVDQVKGFSTFADREGGSEK